MASCFPRPRAPPSEPRGLSPAIRSSRTSCTARARRTPRRARQFAKLIREITVSAATGLPDPAANPRLRAAVTAANKANMTKDTVERAIKKAAGAGGGDDYAEVRYEGYGPAGVAVIVEALTDNRNRTAGDVRVGVRQARRRAGRDQFGQLPVHPARRHPLSGRRRERGRRCWKPRSRPAPKTSRATRTAHEVTTARRMISSRCATRWKHGSARRRKPSSTGARPRSVTLDEDRAAGLLKLIDALEDNDDVQNVYANFDIPDAVHGAALGLTAVMRLLGLDPGLRFTGWGLIEVDGNRLRHLADGVIATDSAAAGARPPARAARRADRAARRCTARTRRPSRKPTSTATAPRP